MPVVLDANFLIDFFNSKVSGDRRARIDGLIAALKRTRTVALIPTPSLTELMVGASKAREAYLSMLAGSSAFRIVPFDQRASLECALLLEAAWSRGEQRKITKTKFKFDWQIVAIAASRGATAIYSDDPDVARAAERVNIPVSTVDSLPIPDEARQHVFPFEIDSNPEEEDE